MDAHKLNILQINKDRNTIINLFDLSMFELSMDFNIELTGKISFRI